MGLSIITPHYNDFEGLKTLYQCLLNQTNSNWEWIIVDDASDEEVVKSISLWKDALGNKHVNFIANNHKSNASICRNIGAKKAKFNSLVFLDADDEISPNFVAQRCLNIQKFTVFKNAAVIDEFGNEHKKSVPDLNFLQSFLSARFIWPITSIIWNRDYFISIGGFNEKLPRLQDVELAIRVLQLNSNISIVDNQVDFYYQVKPIRARNNFVQPVCEAVHLLVSELLDYSKLSNKEKKLLSGYYFNCVRYLERSENKKNIKYVLENLRLFNRIKLISKKDYILGLFSLKLFEIGMISGNTLLKVNRNLFKTFILNE